MTSPQLLGMQIHASQEDSMKNNNLTAQWQRNAYAHMA